MKDLAEFIAENEITIASEWVDSNPQMPDFEGDNWRVTLRRGRQRMTLPFSKGYGHGGAEPTAEEVLNCLALDSSSIETNSDFESWADEYGYDTDSRSAERTFLTTKRQAEKLLRFLGYNAYEELLWSVESL